jgi:AcrR family transcriptional regulator
VGCWRWISAVQRNATPHTTPDVPRATSDRLTRKQAKARTRERLVDAVLEHVRRDGLAGLTTGKIAEAAGIAQSSFYVHFASMDEALRSAADLIAAELSRRIRDERDALGSPARDAAATVRLTCAATLNALLAEPALLELLLGHRRDRASPLGACLRGIVAQTRADLVGDLAALGDDADADAVDLMAELAIGSTLAACEGVLDGRLSDREACLEALARVTEALVPGGAGPQR